MIRVPTHAPPTTPGEMLVEEFLKPLGVTVTDFAKHIGVTRSRMSEIINGRRGITPDTAMRLSKALGTTAEFWLSLQLMNDLYAAQHSPDAKKIERIKLVGKRELTRAGKCGARAAKAPSPNARMASESRV